MVFKRRDRRPIWKIVGDFLWPQGGWTRAFHYVKHRLHRLPDRPERIARGIFAGVFTVFTPFYGLHFVTAAILAKLMRGNIWAALLATFVGNPLTYLPIAAISLQTGQFLLGRTPLPDASTHRSLGAKLGGAYEGLKQNVIAIFTDRDIDWHWLAVFYDDIFFPYMIGGIIPGLIAGIAAFYVTLPFIRAYQHRRKGVLQDRLKRLKAAKAAKAEGK